MLDLEILKQLPFPGISYDNETEEWTISWSSDDYLVWDEISGHDLPVLLQKAVDVYQGQLNRMEVRSVSVLHGKVKEYIYMATFQENGEDVSKHIALAISRERAAQACVEYAREHLQLNNPLFWSSVSDYYEDAEAIVDGKRKGFFGIFKEEVLQ